MDKPHGGLPSLLISGPDDVFKEEDGSPWSRGEVFFRLPLSAAELNLGVRVNVPIPYNPEMTLGAYRTELLRKALDALKDVIRTYHDDEDLRARAAVIEA
jgi:hypothetical protein